MLLILFLLSVVDAIYIEDFVMQILLLWELALWVLLQMRQHLALGLLLQVE